MSGPEYHLAPADSKAHFVGSMTTDSFGVMHGKVPSEWRGQTDKHYVTREEREAFIRNAQVEIVLIELGGNAPNSSRLMGSWSRESGREGEVTLYTEIGREDPIDEIRAKLEADNVKLQLPTSINEGQMIGGSLIVPVKNDEGEDDILVLSTSPEGSTHVPVRTIDNGVVVLDSLRSNEWKKSMYGVVQKVKEKPKDIYLMTSLGSKQMKEGGPEIADVLEVTSYFNGNLREVKKALQTLGVNTRGVPPSQLAMELAVRGIDVVAMSRGGESSYFVTPTYIAEQPVAAHAVDPESFFPLGMGDAKKGGTAHELLLHEDIPTALQMGDIAGARTSRKKDSRSGHPTRQAALAEIKQHPYATLIEKRAV